MISEKTTQENAAPHRAGPRATRYLTAILVLCVGGLGLAGCSDMRGVLGYEKNPPDEFAVITRAPLSLPPNYQLRPPQPGATRPQEANTGDARALLLPATEASATGSAEEATGARLLLGLDQGDPDIREKIRSETAGDGYVEKSMLDKLLFWKEGEEPGLVVDASAEKKRLEENAALGKPVNAGEIPTIERREGALLEGLF